MTSTRGSVRPIVTAMMAITGASFFAILVAEDVAGLAGDVRADLPWGLILRYLVAMAAGGAAVGALLAGWFGRRGIAGWLLALLAGVVCSCVAGLLGSAVGLLPDLLSDGWHTADAIPIAFGLLVVPLALIDQPVFLLLWLALVAATHLLALRVRRAR
jgi:hypothetical protein